MRYLVYDKPYKMFNVMETKTHPTKPELINRLVIGTQDIELAINYLIGKMWCFRILQGLATNHLRY